VTAQALRTDRILYEVEQTGGDVRRICQRLLKSDPLVLIES
jgi:hypothetical protein